MRSFQPQACGCCTLRQRSAWVLGLGLLFLSTVGVRCFVIGENNKDKWRPHSRVVPPPRIEETSQNHRSRSLVSRLFANKDEDEQPPVEEAKPDPNLLDPIVNITSSDPIEVAVPAVAPLNVEKIANTTQLGNWPCFDKLDRELIKISLPVIGNYAINPLIGAVDLFWVNRMGNALAVAGQAAANQVFSSAFWFTSFLPSGKDSPPSGTNNSCFH
jgi:hypothetical protein